MKKIIIYIINVYQILLSPDKGFLVRIGLKKNSTCMFYPTCSDYTIKEISKKGVCTGLYNGIKQILNCHPYSKNISND